MTITELIATWAIATDMQERVRVELGQMVDNPVRGDSLFETYSSVGGAVGNAEHALGMLRELEKESEK